MRLAHAAAMHDVQVRSHAASTPCPTPPQSFFARWLAGRDWDTHGYELVRGRIVRRAVGGSTCTSLTRRLHRRLDDAAEGTTAVVLEPRQGLELPTGDTLVPDLSVVSASRWAAAQPSAGDLLRVVPDLVVEVLPASITHADREEARAIYERAGVKEHWIVDPKTRTVTVSVSVRGRFELGWVLAGCDMLRSAVLPQLRLGLALLF